MKCAMCNGDVVVKRNSINFYSEMLGEISVPDIEFEECLNCGEQLLSPEESDCLTGYVRDLEEDAIGSLPASDLITATEAASILGVTKQAFSKNPRVKRGFVYSTKIGGRIFYSKRSTKLFSETKDGRFKLIPPNNPDSKVYVIFSPPSSLSEEVYVKQEGNQNASMWCLDKFLTTGGTDAYR